MRDLNAMPLTQWQVPIVKWVAWGCDPALPQIAPDLSFVEPMLRRRLSPLARVALHVANECSRNNPSVQVVYSSRHGELARTIESLHNLARCEALSPTTFSLSVLNSAPGVFSIARQDMAASTAVSAGRETFGFGLMEAASRTALDPSSPVLYVYADTPAPSPVGPQHGDPTSTIAIAILVGESPVQTLQISTAPSDVPSSTEPQAYACFRALTGNASSWQSGHRYWEMEVV